MPAVAISKKTSNKRELQLLLGKLLYVTKCVRASRPFLNRMLDILRAAHKQDIIKRPARDACLCMGELPAPPAQPAPHFVFLITL